MDVSSIIFNTWYNFDSSTGDKLLLSDNCQVNLIARC